ncbi:MAG: prolyl oligopeptidase family serine peptidase [Tannerella sp.]|jgi:predicted alpha/beta superfamily hydrolase|nr:prolyl oligopeptidase family serine peptidase [Tannerella sp.]
MKIYCLIVLLFVLTLGDSFSQEDICIGKKYKMYSGYLQEEREYQVYLPVSYNENGDVSQKYPVIYLIDGESFFHSLTAIHQSFTKGRMSRMPECVIVGIVSTDRTRDLTPTMSAYRRDGTVQEGDKEMGGESDVFADFLTKELRHIIDSAFLTSGKNILFGHSYGGLFVLNIFLKQTETFDTYIAVDPSLWWDNARLAKEAIDIVKTKQFSDKTLYIGVAGMARPDNKYIHLDVMNNFLNETLPVGEENGLKYYSKIFPDENHGSIPIPAMIDAFKQIYIGHDKIGK